MQFQTALTDLIRPSLGLDEWELLVMYEVQVKEKTNKAKWCIKKVGCRIHPWPNKILISNPNDLIRTSLVRFKLCASQSPIFFYTELALPFQVPTQL
jgi:hypothetical protein